MLHAGRIHLALVLGIALASTGSRALGDSVTYTASSPYQKTTDFTTTLSVHSFDPSLGRLESVVVSISDQANILGSLYNKSASARNFSIAEDVKFAVSFGGAQFLSDDLNAQKAYTMLGSGQTAAFGQYSLSGSSAEKTILAPGVLAALTGTAPVTFDFSTLSGITIGGGGGNALTTFHTTANSTLSVTYNYIAINGATVPEPASLAMTAMGGLMVAAAGYVRARRARAGR